MLSIVVIAFMVCHSQCMDNDFAKTKLDNIKSHLKGPEHDMKEVDDLTTTAEEAVGKSCTNEPNEDEPNQCFVELKPDTEAEACKGTVDKKDFKSFGCAIKECEEVPIHHHLICKFRK